MEDRSSGSGDEPPRDETAQAQPPSSSLQTALATHKAIRRFKQCKSGAVVTIGGVRMWIDSESSKGYNGGGRGGDDDDDDAAKLLPPRGEKSGGAPLGAVPGSPPGSPAGGSGLGTHRQGSVKGAGGLFTEPVRTSTTVATHARRKEYGVVTPLADDAACAEQESAERSRRASESWKKVRLAAHAISAADYLEDAGFTEAEQPRHAGMIHPHSSFRITWDVAMLVLLVYVAIGVPYRTGFGVEPAGGWYSLELCVDLGFCVDVLFNFRTSYVVPGAVPGEDVEISDPWKVARAYMSSWAALDIISSVPWDVLFASSEGVEGLGMAKILKIGKVLKVFKLLRLSKLTKFNEERGAQLEELMLSSSVGGAIKMFKLMTVCFFVCHYLACGWAFVGAPTPTHDDAPTWARFYADGDDVVPDEFGRGPATEWRAGPRYLVAMYWALTTMTTVGYGDICPESDAERVFTMLAMIVGGAFYGYLIASIATIVTAQNANDQLYLERMDMIHTYMRIKRFPPRLRHRIHRYFKRYFSQRTALDENAILNDLEPALREEVGEYLIHDAVRRNYLFRELHPAVLGRIFSVFRPTSADVGAELATKGARGDAMFVIESGSCELRHGATGLGARKKRKQYLRAGQSFGELVALGVQETYDSSVVATERCEMYLVTRDELNATLAEDDAGAQHHAKLVKVAQHYYDLVAEAAFLGLSRPVMGASDVSAQEADDDDTLPGGAVRGSSLVGGGASTLPAGFADQTSQMLNEIHDEVAVLREGMGMLGLGGDGRGRGEYSSDGGRLSGMLRSAVRAELAGLRGEVRRLADAHEASEARVRELERGANNNGGANAAVARNNNNNAGADTAAASGGGGGNGVDVIDVVRSRGGGGDDDAGELEVRLSIEGRWLRAMDRDDGEDGQGKTNASSDPYLRIVRASLRSSSSGDGTPDAAAAAADAAIDAEAFTPDGELVHVVWTSEVARNNPNPSWREARVPLAELCGGCAADDRSRRLVLQCWDWDRAADGAKPHDLIGTVSTTFEELMHTPVFVLRQSAAAARRATSEGKGRIIAGGFSGGCANSIIVRKCELVRATGGGGSAEAWA